MHLSRPPALPELLPLVETLWVSYQDGRPGVRELVLPSGRAHVVVRLSGDPLRVVRRTGRAGGRASARAVVGGPRWAPIVRDVSRAIGSVGAQLRPGALPLLFGVAADELAGRHTALEELWPGSRFRERLRDRPGPAAQLDAFERLLAERVAPGGAPHPVVAHALRRFDVVQDVALVARESGYTQRHFLSLFRRAVGISPKRYCRVRRLARTLELVASRPTLGWADVAARAGFSDQPHLVREFRALGGLTPERYRGSVEGWPRHVPVRRARREGPASRARASDSFKTGAGSGSILGLEAPADPSRARPPDTTRIP